MCKLRFLGACVPSFGGEQQLIIRQMAAMDQNVLNYSTKGLRTDGEECMSIESLVCLPRLR
jgi:hypothetical protein